MPNIHLIWNPLLLLPSQFLGLSSRSRELLAYQKFMTIFVPSILSWTSLHILNKSTCARSTVIPLCEYIHYTYWFSNFMKNSWMFFPRNNSRDTHVWARSIDWIVVQKEQRTVEWKESQFWKFPNWRQSLNDCTVAKIGRNYF